MEELSDQEKERGIIIKLDELLKEEEEKIEKSPLPNIGMIGMVGHSDTLSATIAVLASKGIHSVLVAPDSIAETKQELLELLMNEVEATKILKENVFEITNTRIEEFPSVSFFNNTPSRRKNRAKNRKSKVKGLHTHDKRNNFRRR